MFENSCKINFVFQIYDCTFAPLMELDAMYDFI